MKVVFYKPVFKYIISCFFIIIFYSATSANAAECKIDTWKVYPSNPNTTTHWSVLKGASCRSTDRGRNLNNFVVSMRPTHGIAGVNNSIADHGFGYASSGGYVGHDHFQITGLFHPTYQTDPIPAVIDVEVDVVDHM